MAALDRDRAPARTRVAAGPHGFRASRGTACARMDGGRGRSGPAGAVARDRIRLWDHHLFRRRKWAAALLLAATVAAAILCRHRPFAFPATLGIAAMAAGFAAATIKREIIAHPVLMAPAWNIELAGFVGVAESRQP